MVNKSINKANIVVFTALAFCVIVFFAFLFLPISGDTRAFPVTSFNKWNVSIDSQEFPDVDITDFDFYSAVSGSEVTLSTVIDEDLNIPECSLYIICNFARIRAYVGDELVYSFGEETDASGLYLETSRHIINFPDNYAGKEIKIIFYPQYDNSFTGLSSFYIGNHHDLTLTWLKSSEFQLFMGIFLFGFGGLVLVMLPIHFLGTVNPQRLILPALISVVLGLYLLSYNEIIYLVSKDIVFNNSICNECIYIFPFFVIAYFADIFKGRMKKAFFGIAIFNFAVFVICSFSFLVLSVSHRDLQMFIHVICLVEFPILLITFIRYALRSATNNDFSIDFSDRIVLAGLMFFAICAAMQVVSIDCRLYNLINFSQKFSITVMTLGALVFVTTMMIHYLYSSISVFYDDSKTMVLTEAAYMDALTGIPNRTYCEMIMNEIDASGEFIRIIYMDLDNLKLVNDNYGHAEGDRLIKEFTRALKKSFPKAKLIGRMGGDEFIVTLHEDPDDVFLKEFNKFKELLHKMSEDDGKLDYAVSIGYAKSSEVADNAGREVLRTADDRMYEEKMYHKSIEVIPGQPVNAGGAV